MDPFATFHFYEIFCISKILLIKFVKFAKFTPNGRSSYLIFQYITEIFELRSSLALLQLFILMKFFVSRKFY